MGNKQDRSWKGFWEIDLALDGAQHPSEGQGSAGGHQGGSELAQ